MYGAQIGGGQLAGTLVALCVPLAGAVNWTVAQRAHAQGHDIDLVPAVLVGAVISSLVTLPLAMPVRGVARTTSACWPSWAWCSWRFPARCRWSARAC